MQIRCFDRFVFQLKGYLGHVLTSVYGLKVIGLESKQSHTTGADKRLFSGMCLIAE